MFDEVLTLSGYEQGAARVVVTERRRPRGAHGLSIEFYGRQSDNRWVEALRVDAFPGEVHYHWFHTDGTSRVCDIEDRGGAVSSTLSAFFAEHGRDLLAESGFYPGDFRSHPDQALDHVLEAMTRLTGPSNFTS